MLTFGQPLALWAFAALALPVLAHMAYRQVTQRYPFPSLRFIKPARIRVHVGEPIDPNRFQEEHGGGRTIYTAMTQEMEKRIHKLKEIHGRS